jgi:hypothetical protein
MPAGNLSENNCCHLEKFASGPSKQGSQGENGLFFRDLMVCQDLGVLPLGGCFSLVPKIGGTLFAP